MFKYRTCCSVYVALMITFTILAYGVAKNLISLITSIVTTKVYYPQCTIMLSLSEIDILPFLRKVEYFASQNSLSPGRGQSPTNLEGGGFLLNLTYTSSDDIEIAISNPYDKIELRIDFFNLHKSPRFPETIRSFLTDFGKEYHFTINGMSESCQISTIR